MKSFEDALSSAYLSITKIALDLTSLLIMCLSDRLPPVLQLMINCTRKIAANQNAPTQVSALLFTGFAHFEVHGPDLHPAICLVARFV
jgi:hypothetical protein